MRTLVVVVAFLGLGCASSLGAWADGAGGAKEALELREASGADWNAGLYQEAAEKLTRAAEIYRGLPGDYSGDLAVVYRALVYNLTKTESYEEAVQTLQMLMDLAEQVPTLRGELATANVAFYNAAKTRRTLEDQLAILAPVRAAALDRESAKLAAQVLHDMAGMTRDAGKVPEAAELFEEAVAERDRIGDAVGKAWSLNNLANMYLQNDSGAAAMPALLEAYRLVHEDRVVAPQASVAINVRDALTYLETRPAVTPDQSRWLWKLAEIGSKSTMPEVIPSDHLLRKAAALTERLPDGRSGHQAAKRLSKVALADQPVEIQAYQKLVSARMAIDAGKAADAAKWLKKVEVGAGLCGPQLAARLHTLRAVAAAIRKKKSEFDKEAVLAIAAWAPVGDRAGQEQALAELAPLAVKIQAKSAPDLQAAAEALRVQGKPGGLGGSASAGGDRSGYKDLGLHDPLFEISAKDGGIEIRDVCADHGTSVDLKWQPRSVALNGLALTVFGGWVRIDGLSYGGGSATSGQPGTTTLGALGPVRPIPGRGALVVLKNGAVTYRVD